MIERFTIRNPNDTNYRAPIERLGEFRMECSGTMTAVFGDLVNRLGAYEDALSIEEAKEYVQKRKAIR